MTQPPPLPGKFLWGNFFLAFLIGCAISALVWIGGSSGFKSGNILPFVIILPLVKLSAGITMICLRKWRSAGIGLVLSLIVGFGIFFSVCASNMDFR